MANATPNRIGQINAAGDADALFLKLFAGEVLTAFEEKCKAKDAFMVRNISEGKSAQFPATWKVDSYYHTPGEEILGGTIKHGERTIVIDDLLVAPVFVALMDEAKNHYDVRSIYSSEMGFSLGNTYDKNCLQVAALAARASATIDDGFGGTTIDSADFGSATATTKAGALVDGLYAAAEAMDEKDVPEEERYCWLRPAEYYAMIKDDRVINRDFDGAGSISKGKIWEVAGINIVKTNHLPKTNITTGPSAYQGNFTTTMGLVTHKSAIGTVKLLDLALESQYDIRRQGTLMVGKYAVGHGILRPECSVELRTAAPV